MIVTTIDTKLNYLQSKFDVLLSGEGFGNRWEITLKETHNPGDGKTFTADNLEKCVQKVVGWCCHFSSNNESYWNIGER